MIIIKRIDSDTLRLKELTDLIGKKVKIQIEVINDESKTATVRKELGQYKLGKEMDDLNLRDFAYEEN
jgi:hypothetical protein